LYREEPIFAMQTLAPLVLPPLTNPELKGGEGL